MDDELRRHLDDITQRISDRFARLEERFLASLDKLLPDFPPERAPDDGPRSDHMRKLGELVDLFPGERPADALKARLAVIEERLARIERRLGPETHEPDPVTSEPDPEAAKPPPRAFRLGGARSGMHG